MTTQNGFILLDKETNISSAKALYAIKKTLPRGTKVGHAGTLDPFASGLLIVGIGKATKAIDYVMGMNKTYEFTIKWGEDTTTNDLTGEVTQTSKVIPTQSEIADVLSKFIGNITQFPPKYSAIHVNGRRAYDLARNGLDFTILPRKVQVMRLQMIYHQDATTKLIMECSKGCYVRSIARDVATSLNTYGHVTELRRTHIGRFSVKDASTTIIPITQILSEYNIIEVSDQVAKSIQNGCKINITILSNSRFILKNDALNLLCVCETFSGNFHLKRIT